MKQSGATLLELMVTLAVSAILLGIGIPSFAALSHSSRLSAATNELVSALHLTRSEAIKRGSHAVMCPSATGSSCASTGNWDQGWVVFHDANNNAGVDAGEAVILTRPALPAGLRATSKGSTARYISYESSGGTKQITGAFQSGTLTVCSESGSLDSARQIIISKTGRARSARIALASCP
jgi:type IV fimbrial biogenesis protein FimT